MQLDLPYGKEQLSLELDSNRVAAVLTSQLERFHPKKTPEALVADALAHPIGTLPLREMSKGKQRITIIASDHTRPVPSKLLMPALLREIRTGNPQAEITILIATGCHRDTSREELIAKLTVEMKNAAKILEFEHAAYLRDKIKKLKEESDIPRAPIPR